MLQQKAYCSFLQNKNTSFKFYTKLLHSSWTETSAVLGIVILIFSVRPEVFFNTTDKLVQRTADFKFFFQKSFLKVCF